MMALLCSYHRDLPNLDYYIITLLASILKEQNSIFAGHSTAISTGMSVFVCSIGSNHLEQFNIWSDIG